MPPGQNPDYRFDIACAEFWLALRASRSAASASQDLWNPTQIHDIPVYGSPISVDVPASTVILVQAKPVKHNPKNQSSLQPQDLKEQVRRAQFPTIS